MINNRQQWASNKNKVKAQMEYMHKNLKQNKLCSWSNYFPKEFIILMKESIKAMQLIEKKLNGRIITLSGQSQTELDLIFANHWPSPGKLYFVTNGSHNILFGPFTKMCSGWNSLLKRYRHFHTEMVLMAMLLWQDAASCLYIKPTYMVSKTNFYMSSDPQVAHTDFNPLVCQQVKNIPYIAFTLCCKEGSMLMIWDKRLLPNYRKQNVLLSFLPLISLMRLCCTCLKMLFMPVAFVLAEKWQMISAMNAFIFIFVMVTTPIC